MITIEKEVMSMGSIHRSILANGTRRQCEFPEYIVRDVAFFTSQISFQLIIHYYNEYCKRVFLIRVFTYYKKLTMLAAFFVKYCLILKINWIEESVTSH